MILGATVTTVDSKRRFVALRQEVIVAGVAVAIAIAVVAAAADNVDDDDDDNAVVPIASFVGITKEATTDDDDNDDAADVNSSCCTLKRLNVNSLINRFLFQLRAVEYGIILVFLFFFL